MVIDDDWWLLLLLFLLVLQLLWLSLFLVVTILVKRRYEYIILFYEVQTFATDREPPTLAMSIPDSKSFCPLM